MYSRAIAAVVVAVLSLVRFGYAAVDYTKLQPVGHIEFANAVNVITFSPDGSLLAVASTGPVQVWDVGTGEKKPPLIGFRGPVTALSFSPDSKYVAGASSMSLVPGEWGYPPNNIADAKVRVWEPATGQVKMVLDHGTPVYGVSFSPDGKVIASSGSDRRIKLWNAADGTVIKTMEGLQYPATAFYWTTDGKLRTGGGGFGKRFDHDFPSDIEWFMEVHGEYACWNIEKGQAEMIVVIPGGHPDCAFSPDGRFLAMVNGSVTVKKPPAPMMAEIEWGVGNIRIWRVPLNDDTGTGFVTWGPGNPPDAVVEGSPEDDGTKPLRGPEPDALSLNGITAGRPSMAWAPNGSALARNGAIIINPQLDTTKSRESLQKPKAIALPFPEPVEGYNPLGFISCMAISPDGKRVVAGGTHGANEKHGFRVWQIP